MEHMTQWDSQHMEVIALHPAGCSRLSLPHTQMRQLGLLEERDPIKVSPTWTLIEPESKLGAWTLEISVRYVRWNDRIECFRAHAIASMELCLHLVPTGQVKVP